MRGCAARALGELGPRALEVPHEIEPLLRDEDDHVRRQAQQALHRLREPEPPASGAPDVPPWQSVRFE